jgi:ElaB/YqjD/DUF883 family membrane-anchored ribosome-binding protein
MARNGSTSSLEHRLDSLKESVRNLVDTGTSKLGGVKDTVVTTGRNSLERTGSLIKEHPIIAIGIAFGIGYLAMRLLRR